MKSFWQIVCMVGLLNAAIAQDEWFTDGAVIDSTTPIAAPPSKRLAPNAPARTIELPATTPPPREWEGYNRPYFVAGYVAPAPPDLARAFRWSRYENENGERGQVGVLILRSQGAQALRVRFSGRLWHPAVQLRVFDPETGAAFPVNFPIPDKNGDWWTTIIFGSQIGLEFFAPEGVDNPTIPEITAIAYHFAGLETALGDFEPASGCPLNDVSCFPAWRDAAARSVCLQAFIDGNGDVVGLCSGNALNRAPMDFAPIIMSARHCHGTPDSVNSLVFVWRFFTPTCNGTPPNPNSLPRSHGAIMLKQHPPSDWVLLGCYEPLGTDYYAGWDTAFLPNGEQVVSISHPGSPVRFMRIAFGEKIDQAACGTITDTWLVRWTDSVIRPGSSGSALFDYNARVRGTASCGTICMWEAPFCCPPDPNALGLYGRLDVAFPIVRWYLLDMANPAYVNRAVTGDPDNLGNTERGTASQPFNTVTEGVFCVPNTGTVRITPGNYNERLRLWRPMRLEANGSGLVRIGAP